MMSESGRRSERQREELRGTFKEFFWVFFPFFPLYWIKAGEAAGGETAKWRKLSDVLLWFGATQQNVENQYWVKFVPSDSRAC